MATQYPSLKLVTEPNDSTSTVLLDLHDTAPSGGTAPRAVLSEGFSLGAPELEGEPDAIEPLYGNRTIELTLEVKGTKAQAFALISSLSRILVTGYSTGFIPGLWLRYQVTPTSTPYWFRLLRPNPALLNWDAVYTKNNAPSDQWRLDLDLPAEAFAYGARETIATQLIGNDPTTGSFPCRMALGTIKGDAPALLRVVVGTPTTVGGTQGLLLVHAGSTAATATHIPIGTGDGLSAGSDTAAASADATAIGGSLRSVSFSTVTTLADRVTAATLSLNPGRYKVLVRFKAAAGGSIQFQFGWMNSFGSVITSPTPTSNYAWADLGDFAIPKRIPIQTADQGSGPLAGLIWGLKVGRAGGGAVQLDHILLIPVAVAGTVQTSALYAPLSDGGTKHIDGDTADIWAVNGAGVLSGDLTLNLSGVFPRVIPGQTNTLWFVTRVGETGGNVLTETQDVTGYYYPRYLNVPPT